MSLINNRLYEQIENEKIYEDYRDKIIEKFRNHIGRHSNFGLYHSFDPNKNLVKLTFRFGTLRSEDKKHKFILTLYNNVNCDNLVNDILRSTYEYNNIEDDHIIFIKYKSNNEVYYTNEYR